MLSFKCSGQDSTHLLALSEEGSEATASRASATETLVRLQGSLDQLLPLCYQLTKLIKHFKVFFGLDNLWQKSIIHASMGASQRDFLLASILGFTFLLFLFDIVVVEGCYVTVWLVD